MINEATLESRLHAVLTNVFPSFREVSVTHQESFTIKFGHHSVKINNKEPSKYPNRAVFDMLLKIGRKNILLVELKREGLVIEEGDIQQGLSYARLIEQMPPLLLVSNGSDNFFYDTYTKQKLNNSVIDLDFIEERITKSFSLAVSDFRNAIELLLSREPEIVGKVLRKISYDNFEMQSGNVYDLSRPISKDFQISRQITRRLYKTISNHGQLVGLKGQAFSGKTCVLYQFFRNYGYQKNHFVLYIDFKDNNISIFQQLANAFALETKSIVTLEKVRDWFISLIHCNPEMKFVLLVDNLRKDIAYELYKDFLELVNLFRNTKHSIIYSLDEWTYNDLSKLPNRNYKSLIGNLTKVFRLSDLNDKEYARVNKSLYNSASIIIQNGGQSCSEYRKVRVLRRLTITTKDKTPDSKGGYILLQPIANLELIKNLTNNPIFTLEIKETYEKLAKAFINDADSRRRLPLLNLSALSNYTISKSGVIKTLGKRDYEAIVISDLIIEKDLTTKIKVVVPRVEELLVIYFINEIFEILKEHFNRKIDFEYIYKIYIDQCAPFPSSDIVGHGVLEKIGELDIALFTFLISKMFEMPPVTEPITVGTRALVYLPNHDAGVEILFGEGMDQENFISQHIPYLILAQLLSKPMVAGISEKDLSYDMYMQMLYRLGSLPEFICRVGNHLNKFETVTIPNTGTFLTGHNGTVDVVAQAIQISFLINPEVIEAIFEVALEEKNYHFLWRLYCAIKFYKTINREDIAKRAGTIEKQIYKLFFERMDDVLGINVSARLPKE